jgi:type IV secretion system protein VirB10
MNQPNTTAQEAAGNRTQVTKNTPIHLIKDKLIFTGIIGICMVIGLGSLFPKHKKAELKEVDEKQDTSLTLHQNMEWIAKLKDNQKFLEANIQNSPPTDLSHSLTKETAARMNAPSTFFSISSGKGRTGTGVETSQSKTLIGHDVNSEFLNQQNDIASVFAKTLPHPSWTVPAGEMISATLETAINSELAGMARAIVTRDIYALSGNKLLIPKGSTLVGQFNAAVSQGQSRIFVVWNRVQMTNGVIVTLNSPSSDPIGRTGQAADYIDRHFFERFGSGALLSVLGAYTSSGGVNGQDEVNNSLSQYRMNVAGGFQQAANQTLQQDMQTKPLLQVNQGAAINVFVAHDLDFYRITNRG